MKLIAKKPCSFNGEKFYIGDVIPTEYVVNPATMEKMGIITIVGGNTSGGGSGDDGSGDYDCAITPIIIPDATLSITVNTDNGDMTLEPTDEGIQDIFTVLLSKPTVAEVIIKKMEDEDALILLHMVDNRKAVKEAAAARAKELNPPESEGEQ